MRDYDEFLAEKRHYGAQHGIEVTEDRLNPMLFPFQRALVSWALAKGRAAIFADCGLGKTPMQLEWARHIARQMQRPVLIATPLAVGQQLVREAEKFGVGGCVRVRDGAVPDGAQIVVTNYERLHLFNATDFAGMVCDESSILKNFDGKRKAIVTEMMRRLPYRLLCTATAAPNDYIELGTSSEALGEMGQMDMLARFFRNTDNNANTRTHQWRGQGPMEKVRWRFKGHAEVPFWRWVSSWARAIRRPSDLGFGDEGFVLPELSEIEHTVKPSEPRPGYLFDLPAVGLREEREDRRRTVGERCEMVRELVSHGDQALVWCHLNVEGDTLAGMIDGAQQVQGSDSDDVKERRLLAFANGDLRVLVTKPKIGAWGLNLQRCAHVTFFPSHSYEQYYQGVRRCWRFGQERPVRVDVIATDAEAGVMANLRRKAAQADRMFTHLVSHMNDALRITSEDRFKKGTEVPAWLSSHSN